ncbi:hypothetical protein JO861_12395 [Rhodococcus hoagii]|uniref:DUF6011 domain-containing protein n=1 Tax=Rhodococcus hoagii TaxID=43767 RepID=UPI001965E4AE|nr:DUF6011 domain-containing protein [Prescottella equi]MBM4597462.1 hypothetical protein [Prescottella equi]MBM9837354.1 hypothetical protein [Prescottella equi]NKS29704.1 hypothetical protein [Prescottella equi]NKS87377.1 hypothetical protein [Prescottella equi]UNQ36633.1 DUF6011 domain-containing protein [Prescottella equi]
MPVTSRINITDRLGRKSTALALIALGLVAALAGITVSPVLLFLLLPIIAVSIATLIHGAVLWYRHRNPPQPRQPRAEKAKLDRLPKSPASQIPLLASHCLICGRPLTNPESMRARVGSTCIKTHGPRYATTANPAYAEWQKLLIAAESKRAEEQVRLDAKHQTALLEHKLLLANWEREVASPEGLSRSANRRTGSKLLGVGATTGVTLIALGVLSVYVA